MFAKSVGASLQVVDAGVAGEPIEHADLLDCRVASGTQNAIETAAMTPDQLEQALNAGRALGGGIQADVACFGEMGIGNTSSATLLASELLSKPIADLAGRGTGLDDQALARKTDLLKRAAARTAPKLTAEAALKEYGGFEIAMMAGAMIGGAATGKIVVIDGFIATASALCATRIAPSSRAAFVFAHRSAEAGHRVLLDALQAKPLLDLNLRLGEGTGALLAVPLIRAAAAMLRDMSSFADAGVSGPA